MRSIVLAHEFVRVIPEKLESRKLYVSMDYATAVHKCCCGCGREVVTPLSPTDWKLIYDGMSISLYPSIGNWSFECQSHYWIDRSTVTWAGRWSRKRIETNRAHERIEKDMHYAGVGMRRKGGRTAAVEELGKRCLSWLSQLWSRRG